jgi:hypothetical protein
MLRKSMEDGMIEQWRAVPGYEGLYEVSDQGRFRSMVKRMRTRVGDIIEGSVNRKSGYTYIRLTDLKRTKTRYYKHRLVLQAFDPRDDWMSWEVNHIDGDKANNHLSNLEWSTHQANIAHARQILKAWPKRPKQIRVAKGHAKGEAVASSKLSVDRVRTIRRLYASGIKQKEIAAMFDVAAPTISLIVNRKQWAHVN